jgi:hypothetical protein
MEMYYPQGKTREHELVVTCSASVLSAVPRQLRFEVKGMKGSYLKYGLDPQGEALTRLGKMGRAGDIREEEGKEGKDLIPDYGLEEEKDWGELWEVEGEIEKVMGQDGVEFVRSL